MLVTDSTALPSLTSDATCNVAVDHVVAYCVDEQVGDEPFDEQARSPLRATGVPRSSTWIPSPGDLGLKVGQGRGDGGAEVDRFVSAQAALAAGEGEEGFDQPCLLVVRGEHLLGGGTPCRDRRIGVIERNL